MKNRCTVNIEVTFTSGQFKVFKDVDPDSCHKSDDGRLHMFTYGPAQMRQAIINLEKIDFFEIVNV